MNEINERMDMIKLYDEFVPDVDLIEDIGMPSVIKSLKDNNINTIRQLLNLSYGEIMEFPKIGRKTIEDINQFIFEKYGVNVIDYSKYGLHDEYKSKVALKSIDSAQPLFEYGYNYYIIIRPTTEYSIICDTKYDVGFLKSDRVERHEWDTEESLRTRLLRSSQFIKLYRYDNFDDALEKAKHIFNYIRPLFFDVNFILNAVLFMDVSEWKTVKWIEVESDGNEGQIEKSGLVWEKWFDEW